MLRLALAQARADLENTADRLEWLAATLPQVQSEGADLLLLPELFACGYNIGDALQTCAEPAEGPTFHAIARLAQQHGLAIHYGYAEREGTILYNAATCAGPDGSRLTHQRKLAIPPGFERAYFTPGAGCNLFHYAGLNIATLICYDAEFPETLRYVAQLGAQLVLVPTALGADWLWVAERMLPTRAYENGVYLAYANSAGVQNDMAFLGHSVIAAPGGSEAARAGSHPCLLYAEIDPAQVEAAQKRLPYLAERATLKLS